MDLTINSRVSFGGIPICSQGVCPPVLTGSEAETARSNGEAIRKDHKGTPYRTVSPTSTKPF